MPHLKHFLLRKEKTLTSEYPGTQWARISPTEAGFDPVKLEGAKHWLADRAIDLRKTSSCAQSLRKPQGLILKILKQLSSPVASKKKENFTKVPVSNGNYRVVIIRRGHLVAEWNHGVERNEQLGLASAAKSIFSYILGIAIKEGKLPSADAKVIDYYPEAMDVPQGEGPKPGRYAFEKDHAITFRQLISNTSSYMKPGEEPGKVFHYQTYGMNILTHAIAKIYGLYDIRNPDGSPGFKQLVDEKLRISIDATWGYSLMNFNLHPKARIHIFGYYDGVKASALDMARLGWLWRNWGRWEDRQLVPEAWLREATHTAPDIRANCPQDQWKYGYAFWTNDHRQLWPSLPRDSYAASGAGCQHIWVCPSLDLVVVQSPGLYHNQLDNDTGLLRLVVNACV